MIEALLGQQVEGQLKNEEMRISCTVIFSCWSNFARLSAGTKTSPKAHAAFSFLLFILKFKKEMLVVHTTLSSQNRKDQQKEVNQQGFLISMKIYYDIAVLFTSRFKIQLALITTKDDF